jgi:coproporphyrinogen III oxidase-like Fe-S oxidoreductase
MAIERLGAAGYVYIGMDHFAKPTDELSIAQAQGRLTRDFQGYSVGGDSDLIGLGVSSIGKVGATYMPEREGAGLVSADARLAAGCPCCAGSSFRATTCCAAR